MKQSAWLTPVVWWAWGAVVVTGLCGLVLLAVQQNFRQGADDPQIQMAEDAAAAIEQGAQVDQIVPTTSVDIGTSLAPWVAFYNDAGVAVRSSGKLAGQAPTLPQGLLDPSTWLGTKTFDVPVGKETRITWQPRPDVRQALVVVHVQSQNGMGYVVAGRSLREVEVRENHLSFQVFAVWVATLAALLVASYLAWFLLG